MAWTSPRTWVSGETVTAALLNTHLRDNLLALGGTTAAWVSFTPALQQGAGLTITIQYARYLILGKLAAVDMQLDITSAGTAGQGIIVTGIPSAIAPTRSGTYVVAAGGGAFYDASVTTRYHLGLRVANSTNIDFFTNASTGQFGANPAVTAASGDVLNFACAWELT